MERTGGEKYATVFYCLLERDGRLSYVNAAHCPPMVVRAGGNACELEATGMPVGLMEEAEFEVAEQRLAPGDKLVIYTDGVTEAQNVAGRVLRQEAAAGDRGSTRRRTCAAIHDAIQGAVSAFTEGARAVGRYHAGGAGVRRVVPSYGLFNSAIRASKPLRYKSVRRSISADGGRMFRSTVSSRFLRVGTQTLPSANSTWLT